MPCESVPTYPQHPNYELCERRLCEARWLLLKLYDLIPDKRTVPAGWIERVTVHRSEQLEHRREDMKDRYSQLSGQITELTTRMERIRRDGGEPKPHLQEQLDALRAEREELGRLSNADLLGTYWGHDP